MPKLKIVVLIPAYNVVWATLTRRNNEQSDRTRQA